MVPGEIKRFRYIPLLLLMFIALPLANACASAPVTDGLCEVQADCPGSTRTFCNQAPDQELGLCACTVGDMLCCPGGIDSFVFKKLNGFDCDYRCRPEAECRPPAIVDPTPGETEPECETDADCAAKVPDLDLGCGTATCINSACAFAIDAGKQLSSDKPGDCRRSYCDILGRYVELPDPADVPFDNNPCTNDTCIGGKPTNFDVSDGKQCPETDVGVCLGGECVACSVLLGETECPGNTFCQTIYCVPGHCVDPNPANAGDETDMNCGGSCAPCFVGQACKVPEDCESLHCVDGVCAASTHTDGIPNDGETGVDCGCSECQKCMDGQGCDPEKEGSDCISGVCYAGVCQAPTCTDNVQNGTEAGKDCGGDCPACLEKL